MLVLWIIADVLIAIATWLAFWVFISYLVSLSGRQKYFLKGRLPSPPPEGFYKGIAHLLGGGPVPWLGKSFEGAEDRGYNIFTPKGASILKILSPMYKRFNVNTEGNTDAYYFQTSTGKGLKDENTEVFKLNYNSPENPFPIRIILDEMVQTGPNEFLGKVHVKVFPGYYATIGFFGLERKSL
jgi:hypothetical protein